VKREELKFKIWLMPELYSIEVFSFEYRDTSLLERSIIEGENPVDDLELLDFVIHFLRVRLFGNAA
jgi:hypothetical protein